MCICTHKKTKIPKWGCTTPPNVPKLGVSGAKDTANTNKDFGMSCYMYIQWAQKKS